MIASWSRRKRRRAGMALFLVSLMAPVSSFIVSDTACTIYANSDVIQSSACFAPSRSWSQLCSAVSIAPSPPTPSLHPASDAKGGHDFSDDSIRLETAKVPGLSSTAISRLIEIAHIPGSDMETTTSSTTPVPPFKSIDMSGSSSSRRRKRQKSSIQFQQSKQQQRSRSSTMPGFQVFTKKQDDKYRDEDEKVSDSDSDFYSYSQAQKQRRKDAGDAFYKQSASVPLSMVQFATEIHQQDRISRREEIALGTQTQEAIRLQSLYDQLHQKLQRQPTDSEWCAAAGKINMQAIQMAMEDGIKAKNKLVTANLRMVQSVVNSYIRKGLGGRYNAGDMMQEGIVALIRAAEKFEPNRGWKFSTYAMYWIRASVKRSQIHQSRVVTIPQRLHENYKRLMRIEAELALQLGRKPSYEELGRAANMSEMQVKRCYTAMHQQYISLDQELHNALKPDSGDRERNSLVEIVEARTMTEGSEESRRQKQRFVREAIIDTLYRSLTSEEVHILLMRYGIPENSKMNSGQQLTIAELSRRLGVKPDAIRRTINRCLKELREIGLDEWKTLEREL